MFHLSRLWQNWAGSTNSPGILGIKKKQVNPCILPNIRYNRDTFRDNSRCIKSSHNRTVPLVSFFLFHKFSNDLNSTLLTQVATII